MRRRFPLAALAGSLSLSLVVATLARPSFANDPAAAESLFREAQELLAKGATRDACDKLEESQRLDPTGATAMSLGRCLEALGKTASAWARYQEALEFARRKGAAARKKELEARIEAIAKEVPKLVISVPSELAAIEGLTIRRGDVSVGRAQWNSAIAVDPGSVSLVASAPAHDSWSASVTLEKGETKTVTVGPLPSPIVSASASPSASAPLPASAAIAEPPPSASSMPTSPPAATHAPVLGYVALGVGVVGIAAGAYFLARHASLADQATSLCPTSTCGKGNHDAAVDRADDAAHAGNASIASFAAGAVLSGLGIFLLSTSSTSSTSSAAMTPWLAPTTIGGSWETRF